MKSLIGVVAGVALLSGASSAQAARDFVWATGSSTVHPFALRVAENTTRKTGGKIAKIESTGTGGGFKSFCGGTGERFPDIANASRPMKKAEFEACNANGVTGVVKLKIGFDGVVVAVDDKAPDYGFTVEQLYLGLAANSLRGGQFVANPFQTWKEVSPSLPARRSASMDRRPAQGRATPSSNWPSRRGQGSCRPGRRYGRRIRPLSGPRSIRPGRTEPGPTPAKTTTTSSRPSSAALACWASLATRSWLRTTI